jgi:hypothetical protein
VLRSVLGCFAYSFALHVVSNRFAFYIIITRRRVIFEIKHNSTKYDSQTIHNPLQSAEKQFSWPLLQELISVKPSAFIRCLAIMENGLHTIFDPLFFFQSFSLDGRNEVLRSILSHESGLFNEKSVIHLSPVASKLCSWARRAIATIFAVTSGLFATQIPRVIDLRGGAQFIHNYERDTVSMVDGGEGGRHSDQVAIPSHLLHGHGKRNRMREVLLIYYNPTSIATTTLY